MIEKLTKKQIAQQEEVKKYWINLALYSGDEIDEVEAKKGIDWLYTQANLPKVEMLLVDSPLGIQYAFHLLKNLDRDKIRNSVRNSVENSVWNSVRNSVENSVGNSVRKEKLELYEFNYQNLTDIGWFSFYDYFYNFNLYDEKTKENFNIYKNFLKSGVFFSSCYSDIAIVSRRPKAVRKNNQDRLHSDKLPAIEWRDGYKLYFLNGVEFTEDLWTKVVSGTMPFEEILAIKDIDQRTQAMKYGSVEEFIKFNAGILLDEYKKWTSDMQEINYKLYKIPQGKTFQKSDAYYMIYDCPSTNRKYMSGVGPFKTAASAMAWKLGITEKEWKSLVPLITES